MQNFKAIEVYEENDGVYYQLKDITHEKLSSGDVEIKIAYSSINYKDMLAVQKGGGVIRSYPMIPGIDLSGTIVKSDDSRFHVGQEVLVTGFEMGMSHTGGFAEYARIPGKWIVPLPENLTLKEAMIIGTAGFTAALSILALKKNGMTIDSNSEILVTGSTGGVGSIAVKILSSMGFQNIHALVRKSNQVEVAKDLGATNIVDVKELANFNKLLAKPRYHYILDTVGGDIASSLIPQLHYGGSMSLCGNAAGIKLDTTVLPFILRGVTLLGIDSVYYPINSRQKVWELFANNWKIVDELKVQEITLEEIPAIIDDIKQGKHLGRTIIKI
ncbi:TPA: YhdH/YhfP family quinone oxidoreductase [Listeria monocytogenes]|nr:YhdH/YhfP family quinone oxidoreductase [Listeria monocytogenes]